MAGMTCVQLFLGDIHAGGQAQRTASGGFQGANLASKDLELALLVGSKPFLRPSSLPAVACQEKQPFERIEVSRQQALDMFGENPFKVHRGISPGCGQTHREPICCARSSPALRDQASHFCQAKGHGRPEPLPEPAAALLSPHPLGTA